MRLLLKMCFNIAVYSIGYQFVFIIYAHLYSGYMLNTFSITYYAQFIYLILVSCPIAMANVSMTARDLDKRSIEGLSLQRGAEVITALGLMVAFLILWFCTPSIYGVLGIDNKYLIPTAYAFTVLVGMGIVISIVRNLQFAGNIRSSMYLSIGYNVFLLVTAGVSRLFTDDLDTALKGAIVLIGAVTGILLVYRWYSTREVKPDIGVLRYFRYSWKDFVSNAACMLIYVIALVRSSEAEEFMNTLAIVYLSVDICWDAAEAIGDYYITQLNSSSDNKVSVVSNRVRLLFCVFLAIIGVMTLLTSGGALSNDMWFVLVLEVAALYLYSISHVKLQHLLVCGAVEQANKLSSTKAICRLIFAVVIISPYSSEFSIILSAVIYFIATSIVYRYEQNKLRGRTITVKELGNE